MYDCCGLFLESLGMIVSSLLDVEMMAGFQYRRDSISIDLIRSRVVWIFDSGLRFGRIIALDEMTCGFFDHSWNQSDDTLDDYHSGDFTTQEDILA